MMVLRDITALTQDKDSSVDPRVSNVILQSTQSPRAPSASQAGEAWPLEQEESEKIKSFWKMPLDWPTYLIFGMLCTCWLLKYKLLPFKEFLPSVHRRVLDLH